MILGIDFSINSTTLCINDDKNNYYYYNVVPKYLKAHKLLKESHLINIYEYEKIDNTILSAINLSNTIISILELNINKIKKINIEDFSFGSKGRSILDIAQYRGVLLYKLYEIIDYNKIDLISPSTVKKSYLKGNSKKEELIEKFLEEEKQNQENLVKFINENNLKDKKPIDDVVDAFLLSNIKSIC